MSPIDAADVTPYDRVMTSQTQIRTADDSVINVVRILVLIQGGIAFVSTLEVGFVTALTGGVTIVPLVATALAALITLQLSRGLRRGSPRARKYTIKIEKLIVSIAVIELLLTLFLARSLPGPVPFLTRLVLPITVIRLLRQPTALRVFNVPPKQRRWYRRSRAVGANA